MTRITPRFGPLRLRAAAGHSILKLPASTLAGNRLRIAANPSRIEQMSHYLSNLRDVEFNLFELFDRQDVLGTGPFEEVDTETAKSILTEIDRISRDELAASFDDGD